MNEIVMAIAGGLISGSFSAGVVIATLRGVKADVDKAHARLDQHIDEHARGAFDRRVEQR